MAEAHSCSD